MFSRLLAAAALLLLIPLGATPARAALAQQGSKLLGTGSVGAANQGSSLALSADGNTAVVGGLADNGIVGAVWFYTRTGGAWSQQGTKLTGAGETGAGGLGGSAAVSADGNTAVVGGYSDNSSVGAVWVFVRNSGTWTQQGTKLVGTGAVGAARQGFSVAVSADGNTLIEGGYADGGSAGAAWVFTRSGGVWTQQGAKLVGTGAVGVADRGYSVDLSSDGNTAIVGGAADSSNAGAAWVFTRSGGVWSQQGLKLYGTGATGLANQGTSVSIAADGNTAVVGGYNDNSMIGAAWVFTRSGSAWTQQGAKLAGTGAVGASHQGLAASLAADGNTLLVGGYTDNGNTGAVWEFGRSGGVWSQLGPKRTGTGAVGSAFQGSVVSLSADGNTALVGGSADNSGIGATWVFVGASPAIVAVRDVPNDQGGVMSVRWTASPIDVSPGNPIDAYWIWRQVPIHAAQQAIARGARIVSGPLREPPSPGRTLRTTTESAQVDYWEYVGSQVAHGFPAYSYTVPTLSDSVPGSNPYTLVMVEAERTSTGEYWSSAPDSGYSVDNLPPGPPAPVAAAYLAGATHLHWGASPEPDFALYRVYRGGSAGFVPGPGNLISSQPDTGYADVGPSGSFYKLSAVDAHGNESAFALVTPGGTTSVSAGALRFALEGVHPNPASGTRLEVAFTLPGSAPARLELLDAGGREVFSREVGSLGAGRHSLDLAAGRRLAPGVYWVRLHQGANRGSTRVAVID